MIKKKNYILIDSRDRNSRIYPEPNQYVIELNDVIKNIFNVKLVYALYPKHGNEFYTNLHIEELSPNAISPNQYLVESFTQLPMISYFNEYRSELSDKKGKCFEQPIPKLGKFTIKYKNYDGTLTVMGEHFLKFEVEYYIYDGIPELNLLKQTDLKISDLFVALGQNFTKSELNREYKRIRKGINDIESINRVKEEYMRLYKMLQ